MTNSLRIDSSKKVVEKPALKATLRCRNANLSCIDENKVKKGGKIAVRKAAVEEKCFLRIS